MISVTLYYGVWAGALMNVCMNDCGVLVLLSATFVMAWHVGMLDLIHIGTM